MDGIVVNSTRREHGGKGVPLRFVLGKSKMILGFSEGFPIMLKGEIAMPQIHYAEDDCPVTAPDGFQKDDELQFEIEMLDFFKAKVVAEDLGVVKKVNGLLISLQQIFPFMLLGIGFLNIAAAHEAGAGDLTFGLVISGFIFLCTKHSVQSV